MKAKTADKGFRDSPDYINAECLSLERERQRLSALKRGEYSHHGYFKPKRIRQYVEHEVNETADLSPPGTWLLDCTRQQANEAIKLNESPVGLIFELDGVYYQTHKNALILPEFTVIRDIQKQKCIFFRNKFYKWI